MRASLIRTQSNISISSFQCSTRERCSPARFTFTFLFFIMCPFKYLKTQYFPVFHEREVFPSHREVVVVENDGEDRWTHTITFFAIHVGFLLLFYKQTLNFLHYIFCNTCWFFSDFLQHNISIGNNICSANSETKRQTSQRSQNHSHNKLILLPLFF